MAERGKAGEAVTRAPLSCHTSRDNMGLEARRPDQTDRKDPRAAEHREARWESGSSRRGWSPGPQ